MTISLPHSTGGLCRRSSSDLPLINVQCHVRQQIFLGFTSATGRSTKLLQGQTLRLTKRKNKLKVISYHKQDVPVLEARSIEEIYDALTERLLPTAAMVDDLKTKFIVGLAGPPGAGKTTLASEVVRRLNTRWPQKVLKMGSPLPGDVATVLPMDGFHLYRSQLDSMENPEEAHARRGAPWTFNPDLLLKCLQALRSQGSVFAPSFDHGVGDPIEDDVFVSLQHKVVIVEGNYLFLEDGVWKEISAVFDENWFIDIDIETAMLRVLKRHIFTGKEPDIAKWRACSLVGTRNTPFLVYIVVIVPWHSVPVGIPRKMVHEIEYNDRPNAELILKSKKNADLVIKSVDL